jgi:hypothetical protein
MRLYSAIALIGLIMVLGCIDLKAPTVDCERIIDSKERDECVYNQSIQSFNSNQCTNILNAELRIKCIDEIAQEMLEFYPCRAHDTKPLQDKCELKVGDARRAARREGSL